MTSSFEAHAGAAPGEREEFVADPLPGTLDAFVGQRLQLPHSSEVKVIVSFGCSVRSRHCIAPL